MWTDRIRPKELPFEEQLAAWEAAGRPDTWTPLMSPRRDIIYITPGSVRALGSDDPATRRKAQKQLFHEFKHARQSEDVLADEAAREWDASHFAKVHGKRKLRKRSRPAA